MTIFSNKTPQVSVIIPCWNAAEYIGELLESLIAQTFKDWRAIVVDDCSTDNSVEIVHQFCRIDSRIECYIRNRIPKGGQTCRNIGFEKSVGSEYVVFFDADDLLSNNCLFQRVQYMSSNPMLDFGIFPARSFELSISEKHIKQIWGVQIYEDTLNAMLVETLPMVGWTNIYRRRSIEINKLKWDENILSLQDSDWNIQAILKGLRFDYADKHGAKYDYYYRITSTDSVAKKLYDPRHIQSHLYLLDKIYNNFSVEQRIKYRDSYELKLIICLSRIDKKNKELFRQVRSLLFYHNDLRFRLRFDLFLCLGCRAFSYIFNKEFLEKQRLLNDWHHRVDRVKYSAELMEDRII